MNIGGMMVKVENRSTWRKTFKTDELWIFL